MQSTVQSIEEQIKEYAEGFLETEYGREALKILDIIRIRAIDAYDAGGVSEATDENVKIAARRDIEAGKLTSTTKLIIRHELGHILDESLPAFPAFEEELEHEKIAWKKAKPKNAAENWYKNLSIRTHIDPLKMQAIGFPRPEKKLSAARLRRGIAVEVKRMKNVSPWADRVLAKRFAMANLIEDPNYYRRAGFNGKMS